MLRAVMVGCGAMSKGWLRAVEDCPELKRSVEIVGFVDLDAAVAAQRAAQASGGGARSGSCLLAMLEQTKPDLVFDIVVPSARKNVVDAAFAHGCHVLSEKPLATSLPEAHALIRSAKAAGCLHAVVQNRRWLTGIRRARQFVDSGVLGDLTAVHCDFFIGAHFGGFREEMEHVLLLDMAIHTFDAARFLTGLDATGVYCRETNPKGSWYAHGPSADALFDMQDGVSLTYRGSWVAEGGNTAWEASWRIIGTQGTLLWDGNDGFVAHRVTSDDGFMRPVEPVEVPPLDAPVTEGHAGVILDFVRAVQAGRPPLTSAEDNIKSLAMVLAAIDSSENRAWTPITTDKESI